jgi:hypothetical protein
MAKKGKKQSKPKDQQSVCNLLLPVKVEHAQMLAQRLVAGEKITVGDINGGRFSAAERKALWGEPDADGNYPQGSMNHALENELKTVPSVPAMHQPVLLIAAKRLGMTFAFAGQPSKKNSQPANWTSHLPEWVPGYTVDERGGRTMSPTDIRRNVTGDDYLIKVGSHEYVIGDDKSNAVYNLNGSKGDSNYAWNCHALKRVSFRGRESELANLVFQINNAVVVEPHTGDRTSGSPMVYLPNMLATAGYLVRNNKTLTYAQIAKAIEAEDTKGIRFKALTEPIVGTPVTAQAFTAAVKKAMSARSAVDDKGNTAWDRFVRSQTSSGGETKEDRALTRSWENALVQTRTDVTVPNCFGLRNSVMHQPIAVAYGDDRADKRLTVIIGLRCGEELTHDTYEAAVGATEAKELEAEASAEVAKEKPKSSKSKSKSKSSKSKSSKSKSKSSSKRKPTKKVEQDVPAAVETSDTADEVGTAVAEAEEATAS